MGIFNWILIILSCLSYAIVLISSQAIRPVYYVFSGCHFSSEGYCPGVKPRRWTLPLVTRFGVVTSIMKILIVLFRLTCARVLCALNVFHSCYIFFQYRWNQCNILTLVIALFMSRWAVIVIRSISNHCKNWLQSVLNVPNFKAPQFYLITFHSYFSVAQSRVNNFCDFTT